MSKLRRSDARVFVGLLSMVALPGAALASDDTEMQVEVIDVQTTERLVEAYPVVLSAPRASLTEGNSADTVLRDFSLNRDQQGHWTVAVKVRPEDYAPGAMLSVSVKTAQGAVLPGVVRTLSTSAERLPVTARCEASGPEGHDSSLLTLNQEALTAVSERRKTKVELLEKMVRDYLTPEKITELQALERRFNLTYSKPITPDIALEDLAYRISAIESLR